MKIIGWTYDADYHCIECKNKQFHNNETEYDDLEVEDSEGNIVHPIFSTDDIPYNTICGDCFGYIWQIAGFHLTEEDKQ